MNGKPTICGFCSLGCAMYIETSPERGVTGVCPSANHPVSSGRLCVRGWNNPFTLLSKDRLQSPLIRNGDSLEPASWKDAIDFTVTAIKRIISDSGPNRLGIIGSGKLTNEECYSLSKLARAIIGTPHVDGACRFYDASIIHPLIETSGVPASHTDIESVLKAGSILIVGSNATEQAPILGSRLEDAARNGCVIVAADPRVTGVTRQAKLHLRPKPGTDLIWLRGLIKVIIEQKLYSNTAPTLPGFEEMRNSIEDAWADIAKDACRVDRDSIMEAAKLLAGNSPTIVMFGLGALQQPQSTQVVKALANVANLLGGSIMPLRSQANAQGACDMGLISGFLPGYRATDHPATMKKWETAWEANLSAEPGMSAIGMLEACASGQLKGLMVFGENLVRTAPNTDATRAILDKVGFLAVTDLYLTETAKLADVVFPACSFLEKDGAFTNIESRVQRVRKVSEPIGESRSDLQIISELASGLGIDISSDPLVVMEEIASNVPQYAGVSYKALDESWGRQWLRGASEARLAPVPASTPPENPEYPFTLIASRALFPQGSATICEKSSILRREQPESFVELNERDAERLGLKPGRQVTVSSRSGSITRALALNSGVPEGCAHAPGHFGDSPNTLASYGGDPVSGTPAYKACAVKIEAVK